jgi:hypothetical protein
MYRFRVGYKLEINSRVPYLGRVLVPHARILGLERLLNHFGLLGP